MLELLEPQMDELLVRIVERVQAFDDHDDGYAAVPPNELVVAASSFARAAVQGLIEQRSPTEEELALASLLGERRARQHVPLENVLRAFRVGAREALETAQRLAGASGLDANATVDLAIDLWDWVDGVSVAVTDAHHRVDLAHARLDQQQRASFLHGLVRGTLSASDIAERASAFSIDPAVEHLILRARPTDEHPADEIERLLLPSPWASGLVAVVEEDVVAVLPHAPSSDLPVAAGIGPPVVLTALPRSFRDATRALQTAVAFARSGCRSLGDDILRAAVLTEDDLGELLLSRHIQPVRALGSFGDELLASVRTFLAHDQNIESAAADLFVHPNTLRHRLARFEETAGVSLRNPEQFVEVWWALAREEAVL